MTHHSSRVSSAAPLIVLLATLGLLAAGESRSAPETAGLPRIVAERSPGEILAAANEHAFTTETLRGKVVWLDEALARRLGVAVEPATAETAVALETADGQLLPIMLDTRGRAFMVDERLRNTELQLFVRRYTGVPMLQVIRVFRPQPDGLYELDYWCDVCAISMYILKDCECCQGPTRLREQRVEEPAANP